MLRFLALCLLTACATAPARAAAPLEPGEVLLDSGGELTLDGRPAATVRLEGANLVAWASTEVPGGSRLQAALAMVDVLVRSELLKVLRVNVAAVDTVVASADGGSETIAASSVASELAHGVLPKLPLPRHAWLKVRRDGKEVLRLYARLDVERGALAAALREALAGHPDGAAVADRALLRVEGVK